MGTYATFNDFLFQPIFSVFKSRQEYKSESHWLPLLSYSILYFLYIPMLIVAIPLSVFIRRYEKKLSNSRLIVALLTILILFEILIWPIAILYLLNVLTMVNVFFGILLFLTIMIATSNQYYPTTRYERQKEIAELDRRTYELLERGVKNKYQKIQVEANILVKKVLERALKRPSSFNSLINIQTAVISSTFVRIKTFRLDKNPSPNAYRLLKEEVGQARRFLAKAY